MAEFISAEQFKERVELIPKKKEKEKIDMQHKVIQYRLNNSEEPYIIVPNDLCPFILNKLDKAGYSVYTVKDVYVLNDERIIEKQYDFAALITYKAPEKSCNFTVNEDISWEYWKKIIEPHEKSVDDIKTKTLDLSELKKRNNESNEVLKKHAQNVNDFCVESSKRIKDSYKSLSELLESIDLPSSYSESDFNILFGGKVDEESDVVKGSEEDATSEEEKYDDIDYAEAILRDSDNIVFPYLYEYFSERMKKFAKEIERLEKKSDLTEFQKAYLELLKSSQNFCQKGIECFKKIETSLKD